jgi:hypothetical protein
MFDSESASRTQFASSKRKEGIMYWIGIRVARELRLLAALLLTVTLAVTSAHSAIYATGFESPPFARGSNLVGQDGWVAPPPFSPEAAVIATGRRTDGKQGVRVRGGDLEHQDLILDLTGGYYDAIGSYRRAVAHDTQGAQVIRISADILISGDPSPNGVNFFSASVAARTATSNGDTAGTGEIAISSDGHVYGYTGNDFVPTFLTSAPISLDQWHNLAIEVDIGRRSFSFLVDGESLGTFAFDTLPFPDDPTITYTNELRRGSLLAYAAPDTEELKKKEYTAYFDNFVIEVAD